MPENPFGDVQGAKETLLNALRKNKLSGEVIEDIRLDYMDDSEATMSFWPDIVSLVREIYANEARITNAQALVDAVKASRSVDAFKLTSTKAVDVFVLNLLDEKEVNSESKGLSPWKVRKASGEKFSIFSVKNSMQRLHKKGLLSRKKRPGDRGPRKVFVYWKPPD